MTSSHKGIIRGADVDGVVFCSPQGQIESQQEHEKAEKDNLKALEDFWLAKGKQEGREEAFQEGFNAGRKEGTSRGEQEGLAKGREEGDALGYERGLAEGKEAALVELNETISLLHQASSQLTEARESLLHDSRGEIISFAMAVSGKIIQTELRNPEVHQELIERLLVQAKAIGKKDEIELYLSPQGYELLNGKLDALKVEPSLKERLSLLLDEQLPEGNCRIETNMGLLNFSLERQLDELERKVLEVSEEEEHHEPDPEPESGE